MKKAKKAAALSLFEDLTVVVKTAVAKKPASSAKKPLVAKNPFAKTDFTSTKDLLSRYQMVDQNKHISHEFQSFGCHLAEALADKRHTSLYIKLAKTTSRGLLERALSFVTDSSADNKAKLFMWKLEQLKQVKTK
jgi:hypothetical protein